MAGVPAREIIPGQPQKLTPGVFVRDVVFDPGIVYSVADVLLFAKTNPVGFIACLTATGAGVALRTVGIVQPAFLRKYPKMTNIALDTRTPLRCSGLALLVVGGAALGTGAILPATTGFLLAVGNFRLAQSISDAMAARRMAEARKNLAAGTETEAAAETPAEKPAAKPAPLQTARRIATLAVKRPDLYINAGFACAGLMAGGAALFVLPLVALSFGVSLNNILKQKPEHAGHPKGLTAGAAYAFAGIGVAEGHGLIALAHAINASVLADAERRVTPGGFRAIVQDVKYGLRKALRLDKRVEKAGEDGPIPIPFSSRELGEDAPPPVLTEPAKLAEAFAQTAARDGAEAPATGAAAKIPAPANDNPPAAAEARAQKTGVSGPRKPQ